MNSGSSKHSMTNQNLPRVILRCSLFFAICLLSVCRAWPHPSLLLHHDDEGKMLATAAVDSLSSDDFLHFYGGLNNFFFHVKKDKKATVAFLGGSITAGNGWRDKVMNYLDHRYPETKFTFLNAGIPSLGSVPHAFRLQTDVLSKGTIDLLFIESAVNDLANGTAVLYQRRALEGIVRHALKANPAMNIVLMAFADEPKIDDYSNGKVPDEVKVHDDIAKYYHLPFINLAEEVARRIEAKEFTWKEDFKDLHPSPFGHQVYFRTMKRVFEMQFAETVPSRVVRTNLPPPLDGSNYAGGKYVSVDKAGNLKGFKVDPSWHPADEAKTRKRFVNVPMLVSSQPGSSFEFSFKGSAVGITVVAGPDAGTIEYSIDGRASETVDLFTQWSRSLHLPWYLVLGDGLESGRHMLRVTLLPTHNAKAAGSACRIVHFLVNDE